MKKLPYLAALALTALLAFPVHAEWVQKEVQWQLSQQGGPSGTTAIWVRDTAQAILSGDTRDTTGWFSIDEAVPPPRGSQSVGAQVTAPGNDTTTVAWLVFATDTAVVGTATLTSMTWIIDGRPTRPNATEVTLSRGWVKADSVLVNGASAEGLILGNESVAVPIRTISPYGNVQRWAYLRGRQTAATGILSGGVRVYIRYWRPDNQYNSRRF